MYMKTTNDNELKEKNAQKFKNYYREHKEEHDKRVLAWRLKNKERYAEYLRAYNKTEKIREYKKEWAKKMRAQKKAKKAQ